MTNRPMPAAHASSVDRFFVAIYLLGIYLGVAAKLPGNLPFPAILAGAAGLFLLLKHIGRIGTANLAALVLIIVLAVVSVLTAPDYSLIGERFKGVVQFAYSIAIGYGLFLAARTVSGKWLANFCLLFCIAILIGCALENLVPAFKAASDGFRGWAFEAGIYESDARDQALYGQIRPKLFTSEPSFVSFGFTLFAFVWYALSRLPGRTFIYVLLLGAAYLLLRGPTILLGVALIAVYEVLLAARRDGPGGVREIDWMRAMGALVISLALVCGALFAATVLFEERIQNIFSGYDLSFFARIVAPPLLAMEVLGEHPFTGAGLGGWEFIEADVQQLYATSRWLELDMQFESAAHGITNYFWIHWIFLGLFWGSVMILALTWFLGTLGVTNRLFCWLVWFVFGQAAGGYVDPRTWTVFMLAAVVVVVHEREARRRHMPAGGPGFVPAGARMPTRQPPPFAPSLMPEHQ